MAFDYKKLIEEPYIYGWLLILLAFLYITFNSTLAGIYSVMVMSSFVLYTLFTKKITINSISGNSFQSIMIAIISFGVFALLMILVTSFLQNWAAVNPSFASIMKYNMLSTALPLKESPWMAIAVWGFLIPIIETVLLGRILVSLADIFGIELSLKNVALWVLFIPISVGFVWFHITAKQVSANAALLLTFVFGMFTCAMIIYFKEMESAIYLHQLNNTLATINVLREGLGF